MTTDRVQFRITALHATVPQGISIEWMGKELPSGPLTIELQDGPNVEESRGELDYAHRHACAEFHVRVEMPELVNLLQSLGVSPELSKPVRALVQSEGEILDDHSFNLVGACHVEPHDLLDGIQARMLSGH